jgi:hypothetical protein
MLRQKRNSSSYVDTSVNMGKQSEDVYAITLGYIPWNMQAVKFHIFLSTRTTHCVLGTSWSPVCSGSVMKSVFKISLFQIIP